MKNNPNDEHWSGFWLKYTSDLADKDEQTQVLRKRDGAIINDERWAFTLNSVAQQLELSDKDCLLDLCCGNGLFSAAYSPMVQSIEAIDLSPQLIAFLENRSLSNVRARAIDIRHAHFDEGSFSKVLWYAGIQYLDEPDIIDMVFKIRRWMKPDGVMFIGDILDRAKVWTYFNDATREAAYFNGVAKRKPIIGTWLDSLWLEKLCSIAGFKSAVVVPQDRMLFYADFRYDLLARV